MEEKLNISALVIKGVWSAICDLHLLISPVWSERATWHEGELISSVCQWGGTVTAACHWGFFSVEGVVQWSEMSIIDKT